VAGQSACSIGRAARLVELHVNTLRKYERLGLLEPVRTDGRRRLYSAADIARLRQIKYLVEERGANLAGVGLLLRVTTRLLELRRLIAGSAAAEPAAGQLVGLVDELLAELGIKNPNLEEEDGGLRL
jgi:MerR family transcriptional regulator/heat shock protein HspR